MRGEVGSREVPGGRVDGLLLLFRFSELTKGQRSDGQAMRSSFQNSTRTKQSQTLWTGEGLSRRFSGCHRARPWTRTHSCTGKWTGTKGVFHKLLTDQSQTVSVTLTFQRNRCFSLKKKISKTFLEKHLLLIEWKYPIVC